MGAHKVVLATENAQKTQLQYTWVYPKMHFVHIDSLI